MFVLNGNDFDEDDIDWEFSDPETGFYYCNFCSNSLEQAGIDAMDPDGFDTMIMEIGILTV